MTSPLPGGSATADVTLNSSGAGMASVGPQLARQHWQLTAASVRVSTDNAQAQCSVYVGPTPSAPYFFSQTITGSTGDTCGFGGLDIQPGIQVWAVWTGGDPGSTATLTVFGTYTTGAP
jgi:hypothetical protein